MSPAGGIGLFESTAGPQDSWYSAHHLIHAYDWVASSKLYIAALRHHLQAAIPCSQPDRRPSYLQRLDYLFNRRQIRTALELMRSFHPVSSSIMPQSSLAVLWQDIVAWMHAFSAVCWNFLCATTIVMSAEHTASIHRIMYGQILLPLDIHRPRKGEQTLNNIDNRLNSFVNDIFKRIATEASHSLSSSSREIQTSVCMMAILNSFVNDIFKHIAITKVATYYTRPVLGRSTTRARTHLGARRSSILLTCMSL
ncbi:hypothetical protein BDZ97DRAFT_1923991 [Flammula alnicola]|nr:hypothetical protein BDZ97DRAFT_1923991 [Flammula alnicola]